MIDLSDPSNDPSSSSKIPEINSNENKFIDLRTLYGIMNSKFDLSMATTGRALATFHSDNSFCSKCGKKTS